MVNKEITILSRTRIAMPDHGHTTDQYNASAHRAGLLAHGCNCRVTAGKQFVYHRM